MKSVGSGTIWTTGEILEVTLEGLKGEVDRTGCPNFCTYFRQTDANANPDCALQRRRYLVTQNGCNIRESTHNPTMVTNIMRVKRAAVSLRPVENH